MVETFPGLGLMELMVGVVAGTTLRLMLDNPIPILQIVRFSKQPLLFKINNHQAKPSSVTESYPDSLSTPIFATPPLPYSAIKVASPHTTYNPPINPYSQSPPQSALPPSA